MNKLIAPVLLLLIVSCSAKKDIQDTQSATTGNHIYYLSIGNGYYLQNDSGKIKDFINVAGANTSADYFAEYLSGYGKGITIKSSRDSLLSKEIMNSYIDSIVNTAVKDSLSTTFIYYCGHGFSDNEGNIYLVPGNHKYKDKNASTLESLVSIYEIQKRIIDNLTKAFPKTKMSDEQTKNLSFRFINLAKKISTTGTVEDGNSFLKKMFDSLRADASHFIRPRFFLLADCCTDKFNTVNYSLLLDKKFVNEFAENDEYLKKLKASAGTFSKYSVDPAIKTMENIKYNMSVGLLKAELWAGGSRTIYTSEIGHPAAMVVSPLNNEEYIGPICRRMILFFKESKTFNISQMLTSLSDREFDSLAPPPKFEEGDIANWLTANSLSYVQKHKTKIGTNIFLDKRDSVNFNYNKDR